MPGHPPACARLLPGGRQQLQLSTQCLLAGGLEEIYVNMLYKVIKHNINVICDSPLIPLLYLLQVSLAFSLETLS